MSDITCFSSSMVVRTALAAASLAAFGVLAGACSASTTITRADTAVTSTVTGSSTVPASSTTSPAVATAIVGSTVVGSTIAPTLPPPATVVPAACANDSSPGGGAVNVKVVNGDWNGDGVVDSGVSWGQPTGSGADWFMRIGVAGGGASTIALGDLGVGFAEAIDRVDVDFSLGAPEGTNRDELLAVVGSNSSGYNLGVFGVGADGCIFRFDGGGSSPYEIPIHSAMSTVSGMTCDGGAGSQFLVRLEADTADGINWNTHDIKVERTGATSLSDGVNLPGLLATGDEALVGYSTASCFGVQYFSGEGDY